MKQNLGLEYLEAIALLEEVVAPVFEGPCPFCDDYVVDGIHQNSSDCLYIKIWNFLHKLGIR